MPLKRLNWRQTGGKLLNYFLFISVNSESTTFMQYTVCLLTHVHCKPTHFFFHSFIATMSYSLQTSFNSVMKGWADKYHVWGTPMRSPSRSNLREFKHAFFHTKKEHVYICSYILSVVYICPIISCLKGVALFYHIPHTYGIHVSLEIYKKTRKIKHAYNKAKTRLIIFKR